MEDFNVHQVSNFNQNSDHPSFSHGGEFGCQDGHTFSEIHPVIIPSYVEHTRRKKKQKLGPLGVARTKRCDFAGKLGDTWNPETLMKTYCGKIHLQDKGS